MCRANPLFQMAFHPQSRLKGILNGRNPTLRLRNAWVASSRVLEPPQLTGYPRLSPHKKRSWKPPWLGTASAFLCQLRGSVKKRVAQRPRQPENRFGGAASAFQTKLPEPRREAPHSASLATRLLKTVLHSLLSAHSASHPDTLSPGL
ncbi:hypothetical protein NDU88_004570 [Pleurodeles waltl]|uniref:Uncharacterized protein n=1 Tax=Pleurodeles waltl TaxID=8319 RepID=A0AAV7VGL1_PLEWA|nr:hypothetical protein NDU88_004570 [Pleurodeles waltl]